MLIKNLQQLSAYIICKPVALASYVDSPLGSPLRASENSISGLRLLPYTLPRKPVAQLPIVEDDYGELPFVRT